MRTGFVVSLVLTAVLSGCRSDSGNGDEPTGPNDSLSKGTEGYYNAWIERDPNNPEAYFGRASRYIDVGHFDKAIADLQHAVQLAPDSWKYVLALSDIYMDAEEPAFELPDSKRAIEVLNTFIASHPDNEDALIELANVLLYVKQYDELHARMDKLLILDPYNPNAWFFKGMAYSFSGDTAKAIRSLQSSLEIDPEAAGIHYELGLLLDPSNPKLAISYYDNAYRLDSTMTEARYMKGFALQKMERYAEAMKIYADIIERDKHFAQAHYNMGYIWYRQDTLDKAYRSFDRAIGVDPEYVDAYYMRGLMSEEMGSIEKAKTDYRQTLNLDPTHRLAANGLDRLKD